MKTWRQLCKLPQGNMPYWGLPQLRIVKVLDELEEIHPVVDKGDKFVTLSIWLKTSPLLPWEHNAARGLIAREIG